MKKIILVLLFVLSMLVVGCNDDIEVTPADKEDLFIVGMECAYAPFNWTESEPTAYNYPIDGTNLYADGYDVQIAKAVAASLGKVLVIKAVDWDGLISALQSGQIDAIIAGMSPTDDRKISVEFTNAYYTSTHVLVMKKDSKFVNGKSLDDFKGANVVGQIETLYDSLIDQLKEVNHQTALNDVPTIITSITSGRSDITILEEPVAKGVVKTNPSLTYIKLENGFKVDEVDVCVSIAVAKGKVELAEQISNVLSAITQDVRDNLMTKAIERAED